MNPSNGHDAWTTLRTMVPAQDDLFHIALHDDWRDARSEGEYRTSTRGKSLEEVGFIHCSYPDQLTKVANFAYRDVAELLVLEIDPELVGCDVRPEPGNPGSDELFPHIYGAIPTAAVIGEHWWERGDDGVWHRPPFL